MKTLKQLASIPKFGSVLNDVAIPHKKAPKPARTRLRAMSVWCDTQRRYVKA